MVEWRSPMHTSGSHNLTATSTGHGPYLPSFSRKDWGCLVALSQSRNRKPGGTLKMSPWPWLREDRSRLTHPERCLSNCSWSVPKQSYRFPSNLKDRENWLLPWSSQQLHITPPCCGSCAKTVQKLCALLKRCILAAPFWAFISLLPSRCSILRSASAVWFAFLPSYEPQTAGVLPVWTEINPNLLCVSVGAELSLLSRLQMYSSDIQSSAYSQL